MVMQRIDQNTLPYLKALDFYTGSDASNYGPAVNRAIAAAVAAGDRYEIVLPNRAESYATTIALSNGVAVRGGGSATEIVQAAQVDLFTATGTHGTKTALTVDADAGSSQITLPTGQAAAFAYGDWIGLESTAIVYGTTGRTRDIRRVLFVSGDVITIDSALLFDVNVADSGVFWKVNPVTGIGLSDFLVSNEDPETNYGDVVDFRVTEGARISHVTERDTGGGVLLLDALNFHVDQVTIDRLRNGTTLKPSSTGLGYGVALAGSCSLGVVSGLVGSGARHLFTTLSDERAGSTFWGGPRDIKVVGCVGSGGPDSLAIFDTHEFGSHITFDACQAAGGANSIAPGFQVRSRDTKLLNCVAHHCKLRGAVFTSFSQNGLIQGGEYAYNANAGVALDGPSSKVMGAWIHHNTDPGVAFGSTNVSVIDCLIEENVYGAQNSSSSGALFLRNRIPKSATQTVGILSLPADGQAHYNDMPGYTSTNAFSSANASANIKFNQGYKTEASGATSVADGGTVAHGMQRTPTSVRVTPSVAGEFASVTAISSTTFTVALKKHDNSAGTTQTVYWQAEV